MAEDLLVGSCQQPPVPQQRQDSDEAVCPMFHRSRVLQNRGEDALHQPLGTQPDSQRVEFVWGSHGQAYPESGESDRVSR